MKTLEQAIADGWGWKIDTPVAVIDTNSFGNVLLCDDSGKYYRIIPEDLACVYLSADPNELMQIRKSEEFKTDWAMQPLARQAEAAYGALEAGQCFHLVTPSVLGGAYCLDNVRKISIIDWIGGAGSIAQQLEGLPDGSRVRLKPK